MKLDKNKIVKPIFAFILIAILGYIKFQKAIETNFIDYVIDIAIVILLLAHTEEIFTLISFSFLSIVEKIKNIKNRIKQ